MDGHSYWHIALLRDEVGLLLIGYVQESASEPAIDDETNAGCLRHLVSRRLGANLRIWCSRVLTLDHSGTMARWSSDSTAW